MITQDELDLLADIFGNTDRPDKITIERVGGTRDVTVTYENLDYEWFRELTEAAIPCPVDTEFSRLRKEAARLREELAAANLRINELERAAFVGKV